MKRVFCATAPDGEKFDTFLSIGIPQRMSENHWSCEVFIDKIFNEPKNVAGVDSWHAMQLAMNMIYMELRIRKKFGWGFSWFDGEEDDLKSLLPPLGQKAAD
ncbi:MULTISPECIES: hypothetical protein [unclassified Janthinobacterium]|uniref:DUF6968 family protein n=1 Tax=unclassified Janthinobacterium TaxID=2610881 RepID=UPI00126A121C|nr:MULTISPECIES: hypothetical protein [unclassified Janthinobacterium]NVI81934.1 hypothetical protein [Janthinobacterium sp. BJB401]